MIVMAAYKKLYAAITFAKVRRAVVLENQGSYRSPNWVRKKFNT
jgi:hypothetical protein